MPNNFLLTFPPNLGNGIALVAYFAFFLVLQAGLAFKYFRGWNWLFFLGIFWFLVLEILGSIAYMKLSYEPDSDKWFFLWLFTLTIAPTFLISSLHLCMRWILNIPEAVHHHRSPLQRIFPHYITVSLGIDLLSLGLQIIGAAYAGANLPSLQDTEHSSPQAGLDIITGAMMIQLCSLILMLVVGFAVATSMTIRAFHDREDTEAEDSAFIASN